MQSPFLFSKSVGTDSEIAISGFADSFPFGAQIFKIRISPGFALRTGPPDCVNAPIEVLAATVIAHHIRRVPTPKKRRPAGFVLRGSATNSGNSIVGQLGEVANIFPESRSRLISIPNREKRMFLD